MPEPNSGCWLWDGGVHEFGYGVIGLGRRGEGTRKAHRVAWELYHGAIPKGQCICHRCDMPGCVNPEHLFLGSLSDNMRDCVDKGRNFIPDNRGERATWAKLTLEQARDIKTRRMSSHAFARHYGVSRSAISQIWAGNNWAQA